MIERIVKTKDYSVMSNVGFNDERLSLKAKGLYGYLLSKPDNWKITKSGLESQLQEGREAIKNALAELETCGYIRREIERDSSGHIRTVTTLHETGIRETRTTDNPEDGSPVRIVSTDEVSTDLVNTEEQTVPTEQEQAPAVLEVDTMKVDIQRLIIAFVEQIGPMPRAAFQPRAAKTLIQRHGIDAALGGIKAVVALRNVPYAPAVHSLEDLRDKWEAMKTHIERERNKQSNRGAVRI